MYGDNAPESANLSPEDVRIFEAGRAAASALTVKTFELWVTIARAVELAKTKAEKIGRRTAFQRILEQQGLAPVLGNTWPSQCNTASKLLKILQHLPQVETWRATLTPYQKGAWAAPTTIYKHCWLFAPEDKHAAADAKARRGRPGVAAMAGDPVAAVADNAAANLTALQSEVEALRIENAELKARLGKAHPDKASFWSVPFPETLCGGYGSDEFNATKISAWFEDRILEGVLSPMTGSLVASMVEHMSQAYWRPEGKARARNRLTSQEKQDVIATRRRKKLERVQARG